MQTRFLYIFGLLGLLLAPLSSAAQAPQAGRGPPAGDRRFDRDRKGPVEMLLRNRAELKLSTDQVTKLQEIDRQMEAKNEPYVTQLVQMRRQLPPPPRGREPTTEEKEAFRVQMKAAEPLMKRIRDNNYACMRQVGEILTDDQKAKISTLLEQERKRDAARDTHRRNDDARN
jgi:Spy/CpxP family protein refolding chaperone